MIKQSQRDWYGIRGCTWLIHTYTHTQIHTYTNTHIHTQTPQPVRLGVWLVQGSQARQQAARKEVQGRELWAVGSTTDRVLRFDILQYAPLPPGGVAGQAASVVPEFKQGRRDGDLR